MFNGLKNIFEKVKHLSGSVDSYKQDSIVQSMPNVAYVNQAKKMIEQKNYDKAQELLYKALEVSKRDARAYKYLGKIAEFQFKYEDAVAFYEKSADINSQDKEIWLRLGMCLVTTRCYEKAIKAFEYADENTPMNTDVQTGWGMALMRLKKYPQARDKFVLAAKISKYNYTAILLSAVMEIRLGEYDSAEMKLKFLTKVAPNESSCYEYANLKLIKSDYKEAEDYAKKSIGFNRQMLPAYFVLGEVYSIRKDEILTDEIFYKALENDLDCENLRIEWGKACVRLFDFEKARQNFVVALEKNSESENAKIGLALVNAYENNFEMLSEVKEKNQANVYIQEAQGLELMVSGKHEEALEMFQRAYKTDPLQTYNLLNIARAYKSLKRADKTREFYEKFVTENPKYKQGLTEYSKWLMDVSDFADARRKLQKAENIDKDDCEILNLLFYSQYRLVKENISEYNVKEAISVAEKIRTLGGDFKYEPEKQDLEAILKDIQGK